jgi:hypothetical protein
MWTKEKYKAYQDRVDEFFRLEDLKLLVEKDLEADAAFSWEPCECCKRPQGGLRHTMIGVTNTNTRFEYQVCPDCLYYNEYGELDDTSMMEVRGEIKPGAYLTA